MTLSKQDHTIALCMNLRRLSFVHLCLLGIRFQKVDVSYQAKTSVEGLWAAATGYRAEKRSYNQKSRGLSEAEQKTKQWIHNTQNNNNNKTDIQRQIKIEEHHEIAVWKSLLLSETSRHMDPGGHIISELLQNVRSTTVKEEEKILDFLESLFDKSELYLLSLFQEKVSI